MIYATVLKYLLVVQICASVSTSAKKTSNRNLVQDVTDIKEFKKVLRTRTNVLVVFADNGKFLSIVLPDTDAINNLSMCCIVL